MISITNQEAVQQPVEMLLNAGFKVDFTEGGESLLWGKLLINAAINPLTALLEIRNGQLLDHPGTLELMEGILDEALGLSEAVGIQIPFDEPIAVVKDVAQRTSENKSSMLQDILRGTPTEVDAINGAIVRIGKEANIPVPINKTVWQLVKTKERIKN